MADYAGWGNGQWGKMPWGGILSQYIKITFIKIKNYFGAAIRSSTYKQMIMRVKSYISAKIKDK